MRLRALDVGPRKAPSVVLIHGLGGLADEILLPLREPLLEMGRRVVAIDRPGYGHSQPLDSPAKGPAAQARWLADVLADLDVRDPLVIGHSFGAAVALWLARELGEAVPQLLLVNPFCRPTLPAGAPLIRLAVAPVVGAPVRRTVAPAIARGLVRWSLAAACAPDPLPKSLTTLPCQLMAQESAVLAMAAELRAFNADMASLPRDRARIAAKGLALTSPQDRVIEGERHGEWLESRFGFDRRTVQGGHLLHHTRTEAVLDAARELIAA